MANISVTGVPLLCHPQSDAGAVDGVVVSITRKPGGEIEIRYRVSGAINDLEVAASAQPDRADGLWKNTCFEIFIRQSYEETYLEYNFAPSGQWAAYAFSGYRQDMTDLAAAAPLINVERGDADLIVSVILQLPDGWHQRSLQVGLSAVLVTESGNTSYWALAHPQGQPDFHHKDCFALQLEAPSAA